jgi:hypothetical protein
MIVGRDRTKFAARRVKNDDKDGPVTLYLLRLGFEAMISLILLDSPSNHLGAPAQANDIIVPQHLRQARRWRTSRAV